MAVNNSLTQKKQTFSNFIIGDSIKRKINETVGGANGQRFITSILSAVSTNPTLQECEPSSILAAAFLGEALKLSPSPQLGQYYMVPFNDKKRKCKVAQFQLGYKGYIQLAIRSGQYKAINVLAIKEGELIKYDPLTEDLKVNLIEDDEIREQTETVGYYAMFEYMNGFRKTMYWSKKKMLAHANKYSQAFSAIETTIHTQNGIKTKVAYVDYEKGNYNKDDEWMYSSFWYKDFDGMAYKTMLRQLISKWGIMSIEMQEAYRKDMAVIKENGDYEYIDSIEDNIEAEQVQENTEQISETTISAKEITNNSISAKKSDIQKTNEEISNNSEDDDFFDD